MVLLLVHSIWCAFQIHFSSEFCETNETIEPNRSWTRKWKRKRQRKNETTSCLDRKVCELYVLANLCGLRCEVWIEFFGVESTAKKMCTPLWPRCALRAYVASDSYIISCVHSAHTLSRPLPRLIGSCFGDHRRPSPIHTLFHFSQWKCGNKTKTNEKEKKRKENKNDWKLDQVAIECAHEARVLT